MDRLITTAEAARIIGCSQQHVRRLASLGKIAGEQVSTRLYLLQPASVAAYAALAPRNGRPRGGATAQG